MNRWEIAVTRDDPDAVAMYHRHYSYRPRFPEPKKFGSPGEYIAMMTSDKTALWLWVYEKFRRDGRRGVNCSVFRNEGGLQSSVLIRDAMEIAWLMWPRENLFTFIDPRSVKSKNPGYCYKCCGWKTAGKTKRNNLIVLEVAFVSS